MTLSLIYKISAVSTILILVFSCVLFAQEEELYLLDDEQEQSPLPFVKNRETDKKLFVRLNSNICLENYASTLLFLSDAGYSKYNFATKGINEEGRGMGYLFVKSLNIRLFNNRNWLTYANESLLNWNTDSLLVDINEFGMYDNAITDVEYIKRDLAIRATWSAFGEAFENTPIGHNVKRWEKEITRYFLAQYSKSKSDAHAKLYLPGQIPVEKLTEKKEYYISMSTFFDTDANSLRRDFFIKVLAGYYDTNSNSSYDFGKKELIINLNNKKLDYLLNINTILSYKYTTDGISIVRLIVSFSF
ncbi:MAG: hypothetical protein HQK76_17870 [Desulfobacterales bacterium]|nr:hypothetical protein [Desulfobacterales bacterium]